MKKAYQFITTAYETDSRMTAIYLLNVFDYLFTMVLISSGLFAEVNPLLSPGIDGLTGFLAKCILPLLLLVFIRMRLMNDPPRNMVAAKLLLDVVMTYYFVINCFHIFWLSYSIVVFW